MCDNVYNKEQLNLILDRVNSWVNNCDQKASIILAFLGALGAIVLTSDIVSKIKESLFKPMCDYISDSSNNSFNWVAAILICLLIILIVSFVLAIRQFILTIKSRTSTAEYETEEDKKNEKYKDVQTKSYVYFDTISQMNYDYYQAELNKMKEEDYLKDICSQIFINSCVCSIKFKHYKKGMNRLMWFLSLLLAFFCLFLIYII